MGNLRTYSSVLVIGASAAAVVVACSSNNKGTVDAPPIQLIDAPADAPKVIDAPPDAPPNYDFSCEGMPLPTTAATSITLGGTAQGSAAPDGQGVKVESFKNVANPGTADQTVTTDGSGDGSWTFTAHANPSAKPYDVYIKGSKTGMRTSYAFPPAPFVADQPSIPVFAFTSTFFNVLLSFVGGASQDDNTSGVLFISVMDCGNTPVAGAMLSVKQGANDVGEQHDLSQVSSMAPKGTFIVKNVPEGATDISATYSVGGTTHTWRATTVRSFKGATTSTLINP